MIKRGLALKTVVARDVVTLQQRAPALALVRPMTELNASGQACCLEAVHVWDSNT